MNFLVQRDSDSSKLPLIQDKKKKKVQGVVFKNRENLNVIYYLIIFLKEITLFSNYAEISQSQKIQNKELPQTNNNENDPLRCETRSL